MKNDSSKKSAAAGADLENGTYQWLLKDAFVVRIESEKYPKDNGKPQMTLIWADPEDASVTVRDGFLKMPDGLNLTSEEKYKGKWQKRLEALVGAALTDVDSEKLEVVFEYITDWDGLLEEISESEQGKPVRIAVKDILFDGVSLFGKEVLIVVENKQTGDRSYANVTSAAPLVKRRRQAAPNAPAVAPKVERSAPAPKSVQAEPEELDDDGLPF